MEKIEPNMYVRTKRDGIGKIISLSIGEEDECCFIELSKRRTGIKEHNILKASHNITELIEEHDLLKIEYYSLRYNERVTRLFEVTFKDERYINLDNAKCQFMLINNDWSIDDKELKPIIKSIVTKQQFEAMQYRIGE